MQLHIRIRALRSLADLYPGLIEQSLSKIDGVNIERVIDDRLSDGMTVTIVLKIQNPSSSVLSKLQKALLKLPKIKANLMDKSGKETDLSQLDPEEMKEFAII